jgi:3-isopropylmalate dehydratase small subunit
MGVEMEEILRYLMKHCSFLYSPNRFRFVDSGSSESFGNAFLVLEHEELRLQFVKDRGQIFLDFQPTSKNHKGEWFSIDIIKQMVTGEIETSAEMDSEKAEFLKTNLDEIKLLFSTANMEATIKKLRELECARAKRLFP